MKCKLGDYIRIKHGFAFKGEYITAENNGVVLVTPGNFEIGGGFKEDKCKFFNGDYPKEYVLSPYDLIVTMTDLSKQGDTLVIHCGKLSKGQERLNESIKNFHVIAAGYLKYHPEIIRSYNFILVDETHRIYPKHYDEICDLVMRDNKICIFSSDPEQVLSSAEKRNGIV